MGGGLVFTIKHTVFAGTARWLIVSEVSLFESQIFYMRLSRIDLSNSMSDQEVADVK